MAEKIKIFCIHPALAPYRIDFFNLLAKLVNLEVAFAHRNLVTQEFDQKKLIGEAKFAYRYLKGFDVAGRNFRFGLIKLIRRMRPNVVLCYESGPIALWLCFLRIFFNWRLWTTMDEAPDAIRSRKGCRAWIRNIVLHNVDGVIVPSQAAIDAYHSITELKSIRCKFVAVPIIHDTEMIRKDAEEVIENGREWRKKMLIGSSGCLMLYVGRLVKVKNLYWLVEQVAALNQSKSEARLFLVGAGPEEVGLRAKVAELHLQNDVVFVGRLEGADLYSVMSAADVLVLPSTFEPYGAVVAEAMQWGTPSIVSANVGAKELINAQNGSVFQNSSTEAFAVAFERAIQLKKGTDSILPIELGEAVRKLVEVMYENS